MSNLFGESDDSNEEFKGFHYDWMTDPSLFHSVNVPRCALDPVDRAYEHPEEMTGAYYFGLFWDDQVSNEIK